MKQKSTFDGIRTAYRAEFRKLFSTRMWWALGIFLAAYMAFLAVVLAFALTGADLATAGNASSDVTLPQPKDITLAVYTLAPSLGYIFPLIIGALAVTAEFRHQTITPTFLAEPRRGRVLLAKLLAAIPVGLAVGVIGTLASLLPGAGMLALRGFDTFLGSADVWRSLVLATVAMAIWTVVGVGFGSVLTKQVASIIVLLAFTQFVEPIARMALSGLGSLSSIGKFLPGAASEALAGGSFYGAIGAGETLNWWQGGLVLLAYALVFAAIGRVTSFRRDIG